MIFVVIILTIILWKAGWIPDSVYFDKESKKLFVLVALSGNILETLKNIDAIGNDFELSVGFCGKDGQTAPVGDGGPHTRILNALVGGMG